MRLPRDISGAELTKLLGGYGYEVTRQVGSHMRLTTYRNGEHHLTIPRHRLLRVGTLSSILNDVAQHLGIDREQLVTELFGKD
jgi:predicted RNA binding protein YcfA (HicA-like mRNA interferase family)